MHFSGISREVTVGSVPIIFAGIYDWLLAYNPFAFYFPFSCGAIQNVPRSTQQLYGEIISIFNFNAVGKEKNLLSRIGELTFELTIY